MAVITEHFICDALRDLVPFVQFKEREKKPRRSVIFRFLSATLIKVALLHKCFAFFKLHEWYQIA